MKGVRLSVEGGKTADLFFFHIFSIKKNYDQIKTILVWILSLLRFTWEPKQMTIKEKLSE